MEKIDEINITTAISTEDIHKNIEHSYSYFLTPVHNASFWRENRAIAIVGGGPSLEQTYKELNQFKEIIVCGSAHDYLISKGVYPDYCVICDPDEIMVSYLQKESYVTRYLIASQCHKAVFDKLENKSCYIWHAGGNNVTDFKFRDGEYAFGGGCTVGTRALCIAIGMGFSNIHLFGFDTCLDEKFNHHAYEFVDKEKETIGNVTEVSLGGPDGKKFYVAGYMLGQLFDFQKMLKFYADRMQITVHGKGLLKHLMDLAKEYSNGKET